MTIDQFRAGRVAFRKRPDMTVLSVSRGWLILAGVNPAARYTRLRSALTHEPAVPASWLQA
jgi:hypothetical protein